MSSSNDYAEIAPWLKAQVDNDVTEAEHWETRWTEAGKSSIDLGIARFMDDCGMKHELIEWAVGVEHLREVGDPKAPDRAVGLEILQIMAQVYEYRDGFREEWRP